MKKLQSICRKLSLGVAVAGGLAGSAIAQEENLVGTWSCSTSFEDPESGAKMAADFVQTYENDGSYARAGEFSVVIPVLEVDTSISVAEAGTWRLVDSTVLAELTTDIEFSSLEDSPSQMEQMILQQMRGEAEASRTVEQTVELTSLTATTLQFEDESGGLSSCQKA